MTVYESASTPGKKAAHRGTYRTITHRASPSDQLREKSCTSTSLYGFVLR